MAKDPGTSASEPVDRDQLLREKEAELARILDQHDDLVGHTVSKGHLSLKQLLIWFWIQVRERYHMETFVTMITGFDPAVMLMFLAQIRLWESGS
jgi:hypothetical protein